ncbi:MAG: family 20 glycosylhydrolase [Pseudomonadales bacterium]
MTGSGTDDAPLPALMPWPAELTRLPGAGLPARTLLEASFDGVDTPRLRRALKRFAAARAPRAPDGPVCLLQVTCRSASARWPALDDDEGYELTIGDGQVRLTAAAEWGVLRGLATLTQLCGGGPLPALRIADAPRFPWRGLMLDVARHFLPLRDLLRTLDGMALCKLNVLHLHLTDDQGFRFASRCFPRLASREHYSAQDLDALVAAAADRGIRVVPELDVPGHTASWLQAYPEWGSGNPAPTRRFGVHDECLDPTRPVTRTTVVALFEELAGVFPDRYLHLGGDEVRALWWQADPAVRRYMAEHGLADAAALQARFTAQVAAAIAALGRRPLAWDEVLHPDMAEGLTVQAWRGVTARDRALAAGCDCVLSAPYYLDLNFPADVHAGFDPGAPQAELLAREDALGADPRLAHVAAGMAWTRHWRNQPPLPQRRPPGRLLGGEACLWSELVDRRVLDVRLWSRLPALAERFWSSAIPDAAPATRLPAVLAALPGWAGIDVAGDVRRLTAAAGVQPAWPPRVDALEPVKWYGRLLGEQALQARLRGREMPKARPYDADTPLNRVVDALPPESPLTAPLTAWLEAERAGDADAVARLLDLARTWSALPRSGAGPAELDAAAARLIELGELLAAVLDGRADRDEALPRLRAAQTPLGEYLVAPAFVLAAWLDRRVSGSEPAGD